MQYVRDGHSFSVERYYFDILWRFDREVTVLRVTANRELIRMGAVTCSSRNVNVIFYTVVALSVDKMGKFYWSGACW